MVNIFFPIWSEEANQVVRELRDLRRREIKIWLTKDFFRQNKAFSVANDMGPIEKGVVLESNLFCFEWNISNYCGLFLPDTYRCLLKHYQETEIWIVYDATQSHPKNRLSLFTDHPLNQDTPDNWYHFPTVNNREVLFSFLEELGALSFALCEGKRFEKVNHIKPIKGAIVYRDKDTGYYWHKDTFHKTLSGDPIHCEVYDSTGKHLGEASMSTGELDTSKKDSRKTISIQ